MAQQLFAMPSYGMNSLDPVPEAPEIELEGAEGSETDVDSGKASDETLSFLRWKLKGDAQNSNPARDFYRKGATRCLLGATCSLLPWIINLVLALVVVILAVRLQAKPALSKSEIPTDVLYSASPVSCGGSIKCVPMTDCSWSTGSTGRRGGRV